MKGVDFFNIRTGEKAEVSRPAQLKAYIESSDMGKNRQSDMKWRLGASWIKKIEKAKDDITFIDYMNKQYGGSFEDVDILIELYNREAVVEARKKRRSNDNPFEEQYLESLKTQKTKENSKSNN